MPNSYEIGNSSLTQPFASIKNFSSNSTPIGGLIEKIPRAGGRLVWMSISANPDSVDHIIEEQNKRKVNLTFGSKEFALKTSMKLKLPILLLPTCRYSPVSITDVISSPKFCANVQCSKVLFLMRTVDRSFCFRAVLIAPIVASGAILIEQQELFWTKMEMLALFEREPFATVKVITIVVPGRNIFPNMDNFDNDE